MGLEEKGEWGWGSGFVSSEMEDSEISNELWIVVLGQIIIIHEYMVSGVCYLMEHLPSWPLSIYK